MFEKTHQLKTLPTAHMCFVLLLRYTFFKIQNPLSLWTEQT